MVNSAHLKSIRYCTHLVMAWSLTAGYLVSSALPKAGSTTQNTQKVIKQREHRVTDPIKIVNVSANSKPIKLDEPFTGDANWLRGTAIRLKNSSDKNIIYVEIQFNFPETDRERPEMSFRSELGSKPWIKPAVTSDAPRFLLSPADEVVFRLEDSEYQGLVQFIGTRTNLADLSTVHLKVGFVVFDDFIGYENGIYFRQDPNKPSRWVPLPDQSQH